MTIPTKLFAPSLRHRKLGLFLTIMVGLMVYVATFAMSAEATLSAITFRWDRGMQSRMTVEIPAADDDNQTTQAERVKQVMNLLQAIPQIERAIALPDSEVTRLLTPWIDQPDLLKALPIPVLIDVERKSDGILTADDLRQQLKLIVKNVRVDDHASWLTDLENLVNGMTVMAGLIIAITAITLLIAVSLICHAIMATEHDTVSLLHILGASERDIADHFQKHTQRLATPSALIGFGLAMGSSGILLYFLRHFLDPSMLQWSHWTILGLMTFLVPVVAIVMASVAARFSIIKQLHSLP